MEFSLEHIGTPSPNTEALKDWYVKNLGAKVAFRSNQTPPFFLLQLSGGSMIELYPSTSSNTEVTSNNFVAGFRHLAIRVESLDAARAELEKKGVQFIEPIKPAAGGGKIIFFKDLDGNLLHLVERLPSGLQSS
jgi:glyoxylase I family protein